MSSLNQVAANQLNSQSSTGPRTEEGKAAAARNATRHGLSSAFALLPHEDRDEFEALAKSFKNEFAPSGEHETFLVDQLLHARWRLARLQRFEGAAFELMLDPENPDPDDPDARIVAGMRKQGGNVFSILQRYASAAERSYHKNHRELMLHREATRKQASDRMQRRAEAELAAMQGYNATPDSAPKSARRDPPHPPFYETNPMLHTRSIGTPR